MWTILAAWALLGCGPDSEPTQDSPRTDVQAVDDALVALEARHDAEVATLDARLAAVEARLTEAEGDLAAALDALVDQGDDLASQAESLDAQLQAVCANAAATGQCWSVDACAGTSACPAHRVFVTSASYDGQLGAAGTPAAGTGLATGDQRCQALAVAAGLGGSWRAWLARAGDDSSVPAVRFDPYETCQDWTAGAGWPNPYASTKGRVGTVGAVDAAWTDNGSPEDCYVGEARLLCFEQ